MEGSVINVKYLAYASTACRSSRYFLARLVNTSLNVEAAMQGARVLPYQPLRLHLPPLKPHQHQAIPTKCMSSDHVGWAGPSSEHGRKTSTPSPSCWAMNDGVSRSLLSLYKYVMYS